MKLLGQSRRKPRAAGFRSEVLEGLSQKRKRLASKFFYDERGSQLFEQICQLPEYYLTRTEISILRDNAPQIARQLGSRCLLIELGSGSSTKTRILLDHLIEPVAYVPIDIAPAALVQATHALTQDYPHLPIVPICADYNRELDLPEAISDYSRRVVFFPGSTIGNFEPEDAEAFLYRVRELCGANGKLLIGADLKKDPDILHAAYNDSAGVTAEFNLNLLGRIDRELGADFELDQFSHYAFYNPRLSRIEMHLLSRREQTVHIEDHRFEFAPFESIHTENSYKYNPQEFVRLLAGAGFRLQQSWTDRRDWFAVATFSAAD